MSFEQFDEQAKKLPNLFTCCSYLDAKGTTGSKVDTYSKGRNSNRSTRKQSCTTIDMESVNELQDRPLNLEQLGKEDLVDIFDSPHSLTPPTHVVLYNLRVIQQPRRSQEERSHLQCLLRDSSLQVQVHHLQVLCAPTQRIQLNGFLTVFDSNLVEKSQEGQLLRHSKAMRNLQASWPPSSARRYASM